MTLTKEQTREYFSEWIKRYRASGVPDDGIAEMFAQWMTGHLEIVRNESRELGQALGEVLVRAGVLREDARCTAPELLSAAKHYCETNQEPT